MVHEREIIIFGAGGFGREVLWLLRDITVLSPQDGWDPIGFADDVDLALEEICELQVLGCIEEVHDNLGLVSCVCGLGEPDLKAKIIPRIRAHVRDFPPIIHPSVQYSSFVGISGGCIVCANTILTTQVELKEFVTINLACTIGHDVIIGEFSTLAPGVNVAGGAHIGARVKLGTGAIILPGISIGAGTTVGAGAVVTKDLPVNVIAVGIPAKVVREKECQK